MKQRYISFLTPKSLLISMMFSSAMLLSACGEGEEVGEAIVNLGQTIIDASNNVAPTVNAGQDQSVNEQTNVNLNAAASDIDGTVTTYAWTQTGGNFVTINNADTANASFMAPELADNASPVFMSFTITVTDDDNNTASDSISITVNPINTTPPPPPPANNPPTVDAGSNQSVDEQTNVNLTAVASDVDGSITNYSWTQTDGSAVTIQNANTASASFIAPELADNASPVQLTFRITVTDDDDSSTSDSVMITVNPSEAANIPPTVNAGDNSTVEEQTNVSLNAVATDSDGTIESYSWVQTSGNPVTIQNANSVNASFIAPALADNASPITLRFVVTVTDNDNESASDSIVITVTPTEADNIAPSVSAGSNQSVYEQQTVTLSASASDSDGNIVGYSWVQTSGVNVTLNNSSSAQASFTSPTLIDPDTAEAYEFEVTVTDDDGASASDSVLITVNPSTPPSADCTITISPGDSFKSSFNQMQAGDTLCLNDGRYQQAMEIPSNMNVRAVNDGMAELDGMNSLGIEWQGGILTMKGSHSSVRGLRVHDAGTNADACTVGGSNNTFQSMSCSHGGSHKHKIPLKVSGSGHLIEDSWFFGEGRYVLQCYGGNHITIRRNVIRWDETIANEPDEPNASMSNYSCSDMIWENNISLDYAVPETAMKHCGDMCMSTNGGSDQNYRVQYLGNMVVNHSPGTSNNRAFRADQKGTTPSSDITIKDFYVRDADVAITFNPLYKNIIIERCTTIDVGSDGATNCNDDADISVRYIDGVKTSEPLFPFVNESLIKRDMCASGERQSDWCSSGKSLKDYILGL